MKKLKKIVEFGFYLFIFLLPWQTRLIWHDAFLNRFVWEYGRFSLYGTEILLWLILFLYAAWLWQDGRIRKINFTFWRSRLKDQAVLAYWLIIFFVLVSGATIFWSLNAELTYMRWFGLLEAVAMLSMVLVFSFDLNKVALSWVAAAVIQGGIAICQFFSQYVPANKWLGLALHDPLIGGSIILQSNNERWLRAYGSLPHPNILAGFMVVAFLFLVFLALRSDNKLHKVLILISSTLIVMGLFFTFSRSGWLAFIFSIVFLYIWVYKCQDKNLKTKFYPLAATTILVFVFLSVCFWEPVLTRIVGEQDLEVASIQLRWTFTQQAWLLITNHPLTGVGIGNYTLGIYQELNGSWPGYYYQPVHNIYLLVLAETGLFGAALFLSILFILIKNLIKKLGKIDNLILFLALLSILIISLFDHYFWTMSVGLIMFWLVIAYNLKAVKNN